MREVREGGERGRFGKGGREVRVGERRKLGALIGNLLSQFR